ncbi:MAG: LicD family protein [Oscillospiraceae bacterium]|nr:LicD family protein [Oscillospiraceae bacterium]
MRELTLEEIKQIEFEILKFFKKICDDEGLSYFLSNGTLLGAVKYKGFIPWDDDIDVFMPRKDYDKLIRFFQNTCDYVLFSNERCENFTFPFAKLCDIRTLKEEIGVSNGVTLGLDIDIFPLDAWAYSYDCSKKKIRKIQRYIQKINFAKMPFKKGRNPLRTIAKTAVLGWTKFVGAKKYVEKIQNTVVCERHGEKRQYMGCFVWPIYGEGEIIPAEVFLDTIKIKFEEEYFLIPAGYDVYLRNLYGDYEKDPPLEKQKTHHFFKAYKL